MAVGLLSNLLHQSFIMRDPRSWEGIRAKFPSFWEGRAVARRCKRNWYLILDIAFKFLGYPEFDLTQTFQTTLIQVLHGQRVQIPFDNKQRITSIVVTT